MGSGLRAARRAAALVLVLALAALLPPPATATDGMAHIPGVAVGDYWNYRISGRENGEVTNEVDARTSKTSHFGKTYETLRIRSHVDVQSSQSPDDPLTGQPAPTLTTIHIEADTEKWVRETDYATVQIEGTTRIGDGPDQTTIDSMESFDPPLVENVYSFDEGWSWAASAIWRLERGSEEPVERQVTHTAVVEAKEEVTVAAGTFTTWRVNFSSYKNADTFSVRWFSEQACELVKEEHYVEQKLVNTLELTAFQCSRTEKQQPTYDTDWVLLLKRGETLPPNPQDHLGPKPEPEGAAGLAYWILLVSGATFLVGAGAIWGFRRWA